MCKDKVFIIAEAGVNHNGCLETAYKLVEAAHEAGADAVKFQTFDAEKLTTKTLDKADYQMKAGSVGRTQQEMLKELQLSPEDHFKLNLFCEKLGIEFMSTAFDQESLLFLTDQVKIKRIKMPSGELINAPLVLAAAKTKLPIILSTGMATLDEIMQALAIIAWEYINPGQDISSSLELTSLVDPNNWPQLMKEKVSLLHCVSLYPAPIAKTHLRHMDTLAKMTGLMVGFSDHSEGAVVAQAACARGARIVEKHVTLSKRLPGPDHSASLEPKELKQLVENIRAIELALGDETKTLSNEELAMRTKARPSLVAKRKISQGEKFNKENVATKRAGVGVSPLKYWDYVSNIYSARDYQPDELLEEI